jgi:hypothetical protein
MTLWQKIWTLVGSAAVVTGMTACPPQKDDKPTGRGTAACNEWQSAYCDLFTRCKSPNAPAVCEQARSMECKNDTVAADCATSLADAKCNSIPTGCDEQDIANPAPAVRACKNWIDAVCNVVARCNGSKADCIVLQTAQVDCSKALGVKSTMEECLSTLAELDCGSVSSPVPVCDGVIVAPD